MGEHLKKTDPDHYKMVLELKERYSRQIAQLLDLNIEDRSKAAVLLALSGDKLGSGFGEVLIQEIYVNEISEILSPDIIKLGLPQSKLNTSYVKSNENEPLKELLHKIENSGNLDEIIRTIELSQGLYTRLVGLMEGMNLGYFSIEERIISELKTKSVLGYNIPIVALVNNMIVASNQARIDLFRSADYYVINDGKYYLDIEMKKLFDDSLRKLDKRDKRNFIELINYYLELFSESINVKRTMHGLLTTTDSMMKKYALTVYEENQTFQKNYLHQAVMNGWLFGYPLEDVKLHMKNPHDLLSTEEFCGPIRILHWSINKSAYQERDNLGKRFYDVLEIFAEKELPDRIINS